MSELFREQHRPQYHITPAANWLNDPNGLVYFEGEYHAFYQYFDYGIRPTDRKIWAHAVSTDLTHWEMLPDALFPDEYGSIWSGSAVVDQHNTSGLFDDVPSKSGMLAFYTSHLQNGNQRQSMAYSKDKGRTWIKYNGGKPIIDVPDDPLYCHEFRDPKVFWHEESNQWMMIVAGGPVRFYSSHNLIDWKPEAMQAEYWTECPDFFPLFADGDPARKKWILSGGGVWYMIGDFKEVNGRWTFVADSPEQQPFNFGADVYAGVTFSNLPDNRRVMLHWMVNISYPFETGPITKVWNGALSLPYEITLKTVNDKLRIHHAPVEELSSLRNTAHTFDGCVLTEDGENPLKDLKLDQCEIVTEIDPQTSSEVGFSLRMGKGQLTNVRYDVANETLTVDRRMAGANPVPQFAREFSAKVPLTNGKLVLRMFLDWSSLELFTADGLVSTTLIYPDQHSKGMELYVRDGQAKVDSLTIYELDSIR